MGHPQCSKCAGVIKATSRFCPTCGTRIASKQISPELSKVTTDDIGKKRNPLVSLSIIAITAVLLGVVICFFIYLPGRVIDTENDTPGGTPARADTSSFVVPDYEQWPNPDGMYDPAFFEIRSDPYDTLAYYDLGYAYFDDGRFAEALLPLEVALEIDPDWYWTNISLANAYSELGEEEKARDRMQVLTQIEVGNDYCQSNAAIMMLRFEADELAAQCLRQAISADPAVPEYHYNLAITYMRLDQDELAEQEFVQTMSLTEKGDKLYELAKEMIK